MFTRQVTCLQIGGRALAASGDAAAGRRSVRRGLAKLEGTDAVELRARVLADLAEIETFAGTPDDVSAALARAEEVAAEKGSVLVERRLAALRAADRGEVRPRRWYIRGLVDLASASTTVAVRHHAHLLSFRGGERRQEAQTGRSRAGNDSLTSTRR